MHLMIELTGTRRRKTALGGCFLVVVFLLTPSIYSQSRETEVPQSLETDPVVLAVLGSGPQSPPELLEATEILLNLGRFDLAQQYLDRLLRAEIDDEGLAALQQQFGSVLFYRFLREPQLGSSGIQFANTVFQATHRVSRDPGRIERLISQLEDPAAEVRQTAITDLQQADTAAIGPLLQVVIDPERISIHQPARQILRSLGKPATDPLLAVLESRDPAFYPVIIELLGDQGAPHAAESLLQLAIGSGVDPSWQQAARQSLQKIAGVIPRHREATVFLHRRIDHYWSGQSPSAPDHENLVRAWHWDQKKQQLTSSKVTSEMAAVSRAAYLAEDLQALNPEDLETNRLRLMTYLAVSKLVGGMDQPLSKQVVENAHSFGLNMSEWVLTEALQSNRPAAATAALEVLGQMGQADLLRSSSSHPCSVVLALDHRDRRVRFAAAGAIMNIDSQKAYAGSSSLVKTLAYFVGATGGRQALVGFPNAERAGDLAGLLQLQGFETEVAHTSNRLFQLATRLPDCEIILLSDALARPAVSELIQALRRDARTAEIPVGLMARWDNRAYVEEIAAGDALTLAIPELHTPSGTQAYVADLLSLRSLPFVSPQERTQHAQSALSWLTTIVEQPADYGFYDILPWKNPIEFAIYKPELSAQASKLLGLLGSPSNQRVLVSFASQATWPLALRQAAAEGLRLAVNRRGILLTRREILQQYDRYNRSRDLDRSTQAVLGSILDTLETPRQTRLLKKSVEEQT